MCCHSIPLHLNLLCYFVYFRDRVQTLQQICLEDCAVTDGVLRIKHSSILKTTKPENHVDDIALPVYKNDNCLCIINTFSEYVNRTKELRQRGCKRLLISTIKPTGN